MVNTITECDKLRKNTILVNGIRELAMKEATAYQKKEIKCEGMKYMWNFQSRQNVIIRLRKRLRIFLLMLYRNK